MIQEKAKERCEILAFWEKHGEAATTEAFKVSRRTLFRWQRALRASFGKLKGLNAVSTVPKNKRRRVVDERVAEYIVSQRELHPRLGKKKLNVLLREDIGVSYSESKVGRILTDLRKAGKLPRPVRYSLMGRTGKLVERKERKRRKKLRRRDYRPEKAGDLVQLDTIVRFIDGVKRYIITAIDLESDFAFAYGYLSLSSASAADFMKKLEAVAPFAITHVQTDNGSEFEKHFRDCLEKRRIIHFHNYPRCPRMNSYVERFNRTIQYDFVDYHLPDLRDNLNRFNRDLVDWLLWYDTKRPHESLGMVSPLRYIVMTLPAEECQMWWTRTETLPNSAPVVKLRYGIV
jgi:transposase InsO family protein